MSRAPCVTNRDASPARTVAVHQVCRPASAMLPRLLIPGPATGRERSLTSDSPIPLLERDRNVVLMPTMDTRSQPAGRRRSARPTHRQTFESWPFRGGMRQCQSTKRVAPRDDRPSRVPKGTHGDRCGRGDPGSGLPRPRGPCPRRPGTPTLEARAWTRPRTRARTVRVRTSWSSSAPAPWPYRSLEHDWGGRRGHWLRRSWTSHRDSRAPHSTAGQSSMPLHRPAGRPTPGCDGAGVECGAADG